MAERNIVAAAVDCDGSKTAITAQWPLDVIRARNRSSPWLYHFKFVVVDTENKNASNNNQLNKNKNSKDKVTLRAGSKEDAAAKENHATEANGCIIVEPQEEEEPLIKALAEPTRVKSPEQIVVRSPDSVNWTVPLETGKTFTVTQNIRDGIRLRLFNSVTIITPTYPFFYVCVCVCVFPLKSMRFGNQELRWFHLPFSSCLIYRWVKRSFNQSLSLINNRSVISPPSVGLTAYQIDVYIWVESGPDPIYPRATERVDWYLTDTRNPCFLMMRSAALPAPSIRFYKLMHDIWMSTERYWFVVGEGSRPHSVLSELKVSMTVRPVANGVAGDDCADSAGSSAVKAASTAAPGTSPHDSLGYFSEPDIHSDTLSIAAPL